MKAAFYTLGCKVNQAESEYMAELLQKAGFEIVNPNDEADYYIVNSCTVTATADQKTRQSVRRFKRKHPNSTVVCRTLFRKTPKNWSRQISFWEIRTTMIFWI
mgnify:CR=1 FL=1